MYSVCVRERLINLELIKKKRARFEERERGQIDLTKLNNLAGEEIRIKG